MLRSENAIFFYSRRTSEIREHLILNIFLHVEDRRTVFSEIVFFAKIGERLFWLSWRSTRDQRTLIWRSPRSIRDPFLKNIFWSKIEDQKLSENIFTLRIEERQFGVLQRSTRDRRPDDLGDRLFLEIAFGVVSEVFFSWRFFLGDLRGFFFVEDRGTSSTKFSEKSRGMFRNVLWSWRWSEACSKRSFGQSYMHVSLL